MRTRITLAIALSLTFWTAIRIHGQITSNPIPGRIEKRGLAVEIRDVVRLPDTRGIRPADQDVSPAGWARRSEEHTSELQSHSDLVCRLLLEKKKKRRIHERSE